VAVMAFALEMVVPVVIGLGWLGGLVVFYLLFRRKTAAVAEVTPD